MRNHTNRQQGGTLLGIIIGLLAGLAIALGVALAITKTPVPFTNKLGKQEKAAEHSAPQSVDPNKGMYGNRTTAKEAARQQLTRETEERNPPPNQAMEKKPENKAAVVELSTTDQPKKADPKITDGKGATAGSEDKWSYYLQAGAFREPTDAENTRAKLALLGVEARVMERQSENGTLYRVRVGPFAQLDAMNRVRGKLSDNGVDAAVVRVAK
jgi:cell division protein FtsN